MCLFTCQKCKTTINQRETTNHECEPRADDAPTDYIAAAVLPIIRKAQADAWDEGFDVGESSGYAIGRDTDAWENNIDNPYREAR